MAKTYLANNSSLTIQSVCSTLELARSSFYAAKKAKNKKDQLDHKLWERIKRVWGTFPGWGYRKLSPKLTESEKRIRRVLKKYRTRDKAEQEMLSAKTKTCKTRKYPNLIKKITKDLIANPTLLTRGNWILTHGKNKYRKIIKPTRPYQLWAGDWKELKVPLLGVTIYIFIIIDCYTRQLMGFNISLIKDGNSALKASKMAVKRALRDPLFKPRNLIMHTDQGSAYLSEIYETFWKTQGASLSTADRGKPTQNPYAEAFFSILSRFCLKRYELLTVNDIETAVSKFIKLYNTKWLHSEIGYITPNQRLEQYRSYLIH